MTGGWANNDEIASSGIFEAVHLGLTVQLIATPRAQLMTCKADEAASLVLERNTERYDHLPVVDIATGEERIVGLFNASIFFNAPIPDGAVRNHMLPLAEEYLIGADASILDFVIDADSKPCRLVLAGARIAGLVSLSDLQRLPVRAALFALITGFEIAMTETIRRRYPTTADWMYHLSSGRRDALGEQIEKSRRDDGFVDALLFTQFCDKADIIRKSVSFSRSNAKTRDWFTEIQKLRDNLAHANEYAASPDHARHVCGVVRNLLTLKKEIAGVEAAIGC